MEDVRFRELLAKLDDLTDPQKKCLIDKARLSLDPPHINASIMDILSKDELDALLSIGDTNDE
ncbi:hypothetical protein [Vibrio rotiferianus]|uniref:hypothetical protein n=1 Tax=Vibrio rotiferianus TaxID=190895 RepID=UPI00406A5427